MRIRLDGDGERNMCLRWTVGSMVQIHCPHCENEIELDDGASGEFACPYCEDEFEWNIQHER